MFEFFDSIGLQDLNELSIIVRMVLATLFGGVLGIERTRKRRAAGFRTYILVCLGSTIIMMTGQYMLDHVGVLDPSRMGAQVVSGIGFLGAGTIMMTGAHQIKGLTTAAGLWVSACMGIAIGIGFYFGAIVMFLIVLLVMTTFDFFQSKYIHSSSRMRVYIIFRSIDALCSFIKDTAKANARVEDFEAISPYAEIGVGVMVTIKYKGAVNHSDVLEKLNDDKGIIFAEEVH